MNKVVLIGRLCNNPEIRYVGEKNSAITSFLIAVNRNFKNPEGNYDADFIECNLWGRRAEVFCQYMSKGSLVGISGSLRLDKFTDKLGNDIEKLKVHVDEFTFIPSDTRKYSNDSSKIFNNDDIFNDELFVGEISESDIPF